MAADNTSALTWIFSLQLDDPADPSHELSTLEPLADVSWIQYLAYHVVENLSVGSVYIRGIIRCYRSRSYLQMKTLLSSPTYKPLRGRFTTLVVADKLRSTNRIGDLYEYGSIHIVGTKRSNDCLDSCSCINKRVRM